MISTYRLLDSWNHGSVIRSWLIELMDKALTERPDALDEVSTLRGGYERGRVGRRVGAAPRHPYTGRRARPAAAAAVPQTGMATRPCRWLRRWHSCVTGSADTRHNRQSQTDARSSP